jgi:uncharacterized RDD family membrane protein YckC
MDPTGRPDQAPDQTPPTAPDTAPPAWQSTPQPTGAQPPAGESWSAPAPAAGTPGPASYVYGDVPNRIIAYIIDSVILGIVGFIVFAVVGGITGFEALGLIVISLISLAISGAYFIYLWTSQRATLGMRLLGLQVGNETDGATLTTNQAVTRWILLGAPLGLASALNQSPGIGILIGLVALVYFIALLVTTAQSPTKQGLHDRYAHTVVVKATRSVA